MFEFLTFSFMQPQQQSKPVQQPPIHISAQGVLLRSVDLTVKQFNTACKQVCYEQTKPVA